MKRILIWSLTIIFIYGCSEPISKNDGGLIGKYINMYETDAIHYVVLNADGTFLHYYKKQNLSALENRGAWKLAGKNGAIEIMFKTWITYGYGDKANCNNCIRFVKIENNTMRFSYDAPQEMNFTKVK